MTDRTRTSGLCGIIEIPKIKNFREETAKRAEIIVDEVNLKGDANTQMGSLFGPGYSGEVFFRGRLADDSKVRTAKTYICASIDYPSKNQERWQAATVEVLSKLIPSRGDIVAVNYFSKELLPSEFKGERYVWAATREIETPHTRKLFGLSTGILFRKAGEIDGEYVRMSSSMSLFDKHLGKFKEKLRENYSEAIKFLQEAANHPVVPDYAKLEEAIIDEGCLEKVRKFCKDTTKRFAQDILYHARQLKRDAYMLGGEPKDDYEEAIRAFYSEIANGLRKTNIGSLSTEEFNFITDNAINAGEAVYHPNLSVFPEYGHFGGGERRRPKK